MGRQADDGRVQGGTHGGGGRSPGRRPLGHRPVIPPRAFASPGSLPGEVVRGFEGVAVADVSDAVGGLYTMDGGMKPLYRPARRILGEALTVKVPPGDNWAIHGALREARVGSVLVVDWRGYIGGCGAGVLALVAAIRRGLAGVVVDGGWRDIEELKALDFPVYGREISPFSPAKQEMGEINVPVCCGGVIVEPGDVIVGDAEGVAVVPRRHAREVAGCVSSAPPVRSLEDYPDDQELEKSVGEISSAYVDAFEERGGIGS